MRKSIAATFRRFFIISIFMLIEFIDELIGGGMDALVPLIKNELHLSYAAIGILLSAPAIISSILDPFVSILGDMGKRRLFVLSGGILFSGALLLRGMSINFIMLLFSMILFYPASGAFVNLTQASLIDMTPEKSEINMSKWTFAGSLGMVMGPFAAAGIIYAGLSWRWFFIILAGLSVFLVIFRSLGFTSVKEEKSTGRDIWKDIKTAFKKSKIVKWLILIQLGDLLVDVFMGFLALYMVDAVGLDPAQAALAVAVWTVVGLAGDFLLIPLLHKIKGLTYLRISAALTSIIFPAFIIIDNVVIKFILLGILGFLNSGWYSILMAQVYGAVPGRSGTALALLIGIRKKDITSDNR